MTVPAKCGAQALGNVSDDMYVYVPEGADLDAWSQRLNYDYDRFAVWTIWDF